MPARPDLSGFRSYEDWASANRAAGGTGDRGIWDQYRQPQPQAQPRQQGPAPQPPRAQPRRGPTPGPTQAQPRGAPQPQQPASGLLSFEQFSQHPDNVGKAPARLQAEYAAYQHRGGGGRVGMGDVAGESLYTGTGDVTGMRDYARRHGMSEDFLRFDEADLQAWQQWRDESCPPRTPYRVEGQCVEKPIDSAAFGRGTGVHGRPGGRGAGGGGGRGGRGGGVGGFGYGGGGGGGDLGLYQLKDVYAGALADPTGREAWRLFAGAGGAQGYQDVIDERRRAIEGMPEGPARDRARAELEQLQTGSQVAMPQQAYQQALQGLSGIVSPELAYVGSERDRALQELLGMGNLRLQRELGLGGLGLQRELGMGQLGLAQAGQAFEHGTVFPWQQREAAAQREHERGLASQAQRAETQRGLFGTLGGLAGGLLFSDIRVKENIAPGRRGLSDVTKLSSVTYNYKGDPEKRTRTGFLAQELEKVAPELVKDVDGIKMVDLYGLTSMTLEAIKELEARLSEKGKN